MAEAVSGGRTNNCAAFAQADWLLDWVFPAAARGSPEAVSVQVNGG